MKSKAGKYVLTGAIAYFAGSTLSKLAGQSGWKDYLVKIGGAGLGAYVAHELLG